MTVERGVERLQPEVRAHLESKFPDEALRRVAHAGIDYWRSHGGYLPELAELLLATRAERDRLLAVYDAAENMVACDPWADPTDDVVAVMHALAAAVAAVKEGEAS